MTHKMADDVNMPEDHVNGFEETPGEGEKHGENVEIDEHTIEDEENLEELVENASNEYQDINNTLDQIDSWMTNIETQNDSLVSKLQELLESNRQMRAELQQENAAENNS
ncbi:bublin coiled-coil protein-like [Crassostrea virginica]